MKTIHFEKIVSDIYELFSQTGVFCISMGCKLKSHGEVKYRASESVYNHMIKK